MKISLFAIASVAFVASAAFAAPIVAPSSSTLAVRSSCDPNLIDSLGKALKDLGLRKRDDSDDIISELSAALKDLGLRKREDSDLITELNNALKDLGLRKRGDDDDECKKNLLDEVDAALADLGL